MLRKFAILAAPLVLSLAWAAPAKADEVLFNPNGTGAGGAFNIDLLDPTVGNSLTYAPNGLGVGSTVQVFFQANLGITSDNGTGNFLNGGGGKFFTFAGSFTEQVLSNDGAGKLTFGLTAGTNVLNMYENNVIGNNLTGSCFTCGTLVISAALNTSSSGFTISGGGLGTPLDNFGTDNYSSIDSITGNGSVTLTATPTFVNAGYFPNFPALTSLVLATSEQNLNFGQANPSSCFSSNAVTDSNVIGAGNGLGSCGGGATGNLGLVNGGVNPITGAQLTPYTQFQSDANVSFQLPSTVPEPATLTLLGVGLLGSAAARRRQKKAKK